MNVLKVLSIHLWNKLLLLLLPEKKLIARFIWQFMKNMQVTAFGWYFNI